MTALATLAAALPGVEIRLPSNIVRIDSQADLYGLGVRLLGFVEVADELEAVERAEGRMAYLLKSKVLPCFYLIFPHVTVEVLP
jgi:hypothetical protein